VARRVVSVGSGLIALALSSLACSRGTAQHVSEGHSLPAGGQCKSDEVPYFEAGCDGTAQQRCWSTTVHPMPGEWCGCDGQTFSGTLASHRFRFEGSCQVSATIDGTKDGAPPGAPTDQSCSQRAFTLKPCSPRSRSAVTSTLRFRIAGTSSSNQMELGQFEGTCRQVPATSPTLIRVVCSTSVEERNELAMTREPDAVVVRHTRFSRGSAAPARELARIPAPAGQTVLVTPLVIAEPPAPPLEIRFGFIATPDLDGRPTANSSVGFYMPLASSYVGKYPGTCQDQAPIAPALVRLVCGVGTATSYDLSIQREGNELVLTERRGAAAARVIARYPIPAGIHIDTAPARRD